MIEALIALGSILFVIILVSFLFSGVLGAFGIRVSMPKAFLILLTFGAVLILAFLLLNLVLAMFGLAIAA